MNSRAVRSFRLCGWHLMRPFHRCGMLLALGLWSGSAFWVKFKVRVRLWFWVVVLFCILYRYCTVSAILRSPHLYSTVCNFALYHFPLDDSKTVTIWYYMWIFSRCSKIRPIFCTMTDSFLLYSDRWSFPTNPNQCHSSRLWCCALDFCDSRYSDFC